MAVTADAMTRTFEVALLARPAEGARGPWRHVGRQPIGRLQVERMRQGFPSPELTWSDFPEPTVVYGAVVLDPSSDPARALGFEFRWTMNVGPHDHLRWTYP